MSDASSIVELLHIRAAETPDRIAYRFLVDGEAEASAVTYAQLDSLARSIAAALLERNAAGERALLLFPQTLDFISAFLGCLYAGTAAVPLYPPRSHRSLPRLTAITADARPRFILTTSGKLSSIRSWVSQLPGDHKIEVIATDRIVAGDSANWRLPEIDTGNLAFLQYTSGSTAAPKGVMVTHANLLHNERTIARAFSQSESSVIVSWLPLYHDMGLIGGVLQPLYLGAECILMSPLAFVQKPVRWLRAITRYQATTSGGPNFAYGLCTDRLKVEELDQIDLSSWKVAFNGAEPVQVETLKKFARTFAACGFREEAFYPCYGLAEATLFVTGGSAGSALSLQTVDSHSLQQGRVAAAGGTDGKVLVGCGHAWEEQEVLIVNPEERTICAADEVGEIWISGPGVTQGYWNKPHDTERDFHASLAHEAGKPDRRLYLRTGDLGFLRGGELFVTGRMKDLIIVRGRNYYPQDLELTAERTHDALRRGCGAAFFVDGGAGERVVLVQEIDDVPTAAKLQSVMEGIRSAVVQEHELALNDVVLIKAGSIPKTSSGKIQRLACKEKYLSGGFQVIARDTGRESPEMEEIELPGEEVNRQSLLLLDEADRRKRLERWITGFAARALHLPSRAIAADQSLSALGLDSLAAIELKHVIEEGTGVQLSFAMLLEGATVGQLVTEVAAGISQPAAVEDWSGSRGEAPEEFPLSYGQRGLWFVQQIAPESAAYNIAVAARARGPLDVPALRRAVQSLMDRHPALRTTFHQGEGGEPVQRVHDSMAADLEFADLNGSSEEAVMNRMNRNAWKAFNLECGPLFRVVALRRNDHEHLLLFVMHHICGDFWSFTIAFDELAQLYRQEIGVADAGLSPVGLRYSDYVEHQRRRLSGKRGEQLWDYWSGQLRQPLPHLDLPTDRPRPPVQTFGGATRAISLDSELTDRLHEVSRSCGATLYMTLLAAFQVLLHRYTGQEDIITGSPAAGREGPQLAGIIGYFTNPLVMRQTVSGDATFRQILESARHTVLGALENQEYPFPLLTERLQPVRDPSRSPLFQTMFILQKARREELDALTAFALGEAESEVSLGPVTLRAIELPEQQVPFDLTLLMGQGKTSLRASLQYNRDLFDDTTADRILRQFVTLLRGIADGPDQRVQFLPLLDEHDLGELAGWNATAKDYPRDALLHELFEAQTRRSPEAEAVADAKTALSYAELDARANQLARHLKGLGAGAESVIGVCLERSVSIAVALIGILKTGAAYLPLDSAFPETRTRFMLEDARVRVLLTETALQPRFEGLSCDVVLMDKDWDRIAEHAPAAIAAECDSRNLAYVIYTSGSTGLPKGVQITHQAVVNFLTSMALAPGLAPTDTLASVTTISFDIFGLELYLPLICGARVILVPRETAMDGYRLLELLKERQATVMQATPATWHLLLTAGNRELPPMRALCGGDILPPDLMNQLRACGCSVWNLYGPTETTIWSTVHDAKSGANHVAGTMIGRPIANTQVYMLDAGLQPLPAGVPGELVIGGDGVARGYWQKPDLTAEKFIPDPFSHSPGARLYRTGDLARRQADGAIEFLGRLDHQVKIRGYRIELGEIESVLSAYPGVKQAVVAARTQAGGDQRLVAYLVPDSGRKHESLQARDLRQFLAQRLPEVFVPSHFVVLEKLPLTANGKVDRKALPAPPAHVAEKRDHVPPQSDLERVIAGIWKKVLGVEKAGIHDNFFDAGGHSLLLAKVQSALRQAGHDVSMMDLFRCPTIADIARHIGQESAEATAVQAGVHAARMRRRAGHTMVRDVAIIGMAGRFPRAENAEEFWKKISQGEECISFFSDREIEETGIDPYVLKAPNYVKAGGVLEGDDLFDAAFFGFNPRDAELMDPQHRLFLECAWHALEDAGYDSGRYPGRIGLFAGAGLNTYLHRAASAIGESPSLRYQAFIGNDKDFVATRVSYKLNLRGPSVTVQTACSTSLVAVHLACQSLLNGECEMAMAGAVGVRLPQREGYLYEAGGILSPDGHCRAFDKDAAGTVFGSGLGAVVLKPLESAIGDGDTIYAVIKGTAINNDGSLKIGYTAPGVEGQTEVIAEALSVAGIGPDTVTYVETHGTGTTLGDPIEIQALSDVFRAKTDKKGFCAIGSVKTNIGHLDTAAGIAGLIKTICALRHRQIPPSLNFSEPNPGIDFGASPFYVNTKLKEWPRNGAPRRAGVSSFGIGGTNAHVVLEEAPCMEKIDRPSRSWKLLAISARTQSALDTASRELAAALGTHPETELADVSYTLHVGRRPLPWRRIALCREHEDAIAALEALDPELVLTESQEDSPPGIAFLFPGQGAQYVNMARELHEREPSFRRQFDSCAEILKSHLDIDIRQLLFVEAPGEQAAGRLEQTAFTQPCLFAVEYALARLWMEWGVAPQAMLGHSIGEYVAACLAGVMALEDALGLVATRGRLMQALPPGAMLGVRLPELETVALLRDETCIAAVNSPQSCVVSGRTEAIREMEKDLESRGVPFSRLHTSHAFHSAMMDPIVEDFVRAAGRIPLHAPRIPYISNLTGDWTTEAQATDPRYWGEHLRHAVRFADGIRQLISNGHRIFLECGPGNTLSALARQQEGRAAVISCLPRAGERRSDSLSVLRALGKLWLKGVDVNWNAFYAHERRMRVPLPHYPFERQRYWIKPDGRAEHERKKRTIDDWFYVPGWQPSALVHPDGLKIDSPILVLEDGFGFSRRLAERMKRQGAEVAVAGMGENFSLADERTYVLNPREKDHYRTLLADLAGSGALPRTIVHAWNLTPAASQPASVASWEEARVRGFDSLVFLVQALESMNSKEAINITVLSSNMQKVGGEPVLQPEKAILLGPVKVIPQEHPDIRCRSIDLVLPEFDGATEDLIDDLLADLAVFESNEIAYRGRERWARLFGPVRLGPEIRPNPRLKEKGVYLITGGLGGIGLAFAEKLALEAQARLILTARSAFPAKDEWEEWVAVRGEQDERTQIIRKLQAMEEAGARVAVIPADVADMDAMRSALQKAEDHFGEISGVIHAAGVPGGGIIQAKTPELSSLVLRPKVQGALVLQSLLKDRRLDFFLLCSSINSIIGGFGQSDYCAANAFFDAFAQANFSRRGCYTVSVNWDRWSDVGMAARPFSSGYSGLPRFLDMTVTTAPGPGHMLLGEMITETHEREVHAASFSPERQWVLSEHRIAGSPVVPGTTYLEMAHAVFARHARGNPVSILQTVFSAPLVVKEGETKNVLTVLEKKSESFLFRVLSKADEEGQPGALWEEHARGDIAIANGDGKGHERFDLIKLLRDFEGNGRVTGHGADHTQRRKFITTGPRWNVLRNVYVMGGQSLALLELDERFAEDLAHYWLHPAVLDVATGFVHFLTDGDFLPLTYERIVVWARLPGKIFSYLRLRGDLQTTSDVITSDISILDESGSELVRIDGFSMKRVREESVAQWRRPAPSADVNAKIERRLQRSFTAGMSREQGSETFCRVLTHGRSPQIIVSTRDLDEAMQEAGALNRTRLLAEIESLGSAQPEHARPDLSSAYTEPEDELERRIAVIWQRVLGIDRVGIYDNFFELGGTSLNGVQLVAELKKELNMDIPTVSIFEASTVAALAKYLRPGQDQAVFERVQSRAQLKKQALGTAQRLRTGAKQ